MTDADTAQRVRLVPTTLCDEDQERTKTVYSLEVEGSVLSALLKGLALILESHVWEEENRLVFDNLLITSSEGAAPHQAMSDAMEDLLSWFKKHHTCLLDSGLASIESNIEWLKNNPPQEDEDAHQADQSSASA